MENRKIKDSWSKIKPDDATHERILNNILDRKHTGETRKGKEYDMAIQPMRILAPIAACLIVALAISIQPIEPSQSGVENPVVYPVIHMNSFTENNSARLYFDPETTYRETWDWDKVVEYLGKDITPDYLMPGLQTNPWIENLNMIILNNDGSMAHDNIWLEYYTEYPYEDGSRVIGDNSTGIRIIASKMEGINDCGVVWAEDMEESLLNDVIVRFGHKRFDQWEMYVAEFSKDDISYHVLSSNISEQEFVKMVDALTAK